MFFQCQWFVRSVYRSETDAAIIDNSRYLYFVWLVIIICVITRTASCSNLKPTFSVGAEDVDEILSRTKCNAVRGDCITRI